MVVDYLKEKKIIEDWDKEYDQESNLSFIEIAVLMGDYSDQRIKKLEDKILKICGHYNTIRENGLDTCLDCGAKDLNGI